MMTTEQQIKTTVTRLHDLCTKQKLTVTYVDVVVLPPVQQLKEEPTEDATASNVYLGGVSDQDEGFDVKSMSEEQIAMKPEFLNEIMALIDDAGKNAPRIKKKKLRTPAPVFEIQVTVGDSITANGQGDISNQLFKHNSAVPLLVLWFFEILSS